MLEELSATNDDDIRVVASDTDLDVSVYDDDIRVVVDASISINGQGIIPGGLLGEVLTKKSEGDFDTEWKLPINLPADGTAGQILTKLSDTPYATAWLDVPPGVPAGGLTGQVLSKVSDSNFDMQWSTPLDTSNFVAKSGDAMTGLLTLSADPIDSLHAVTKQYADTKAPLDSPAFINVPTAPHPSAGDSSNQLATTQFVQSVTGNFLPLVGGALAGFLLLHANPTSALHAATKQYVDTKAPINSPAFTGFPTAITPAPGTNNTQLATTAFVEAKAGLYLPLTGGALTNFLTLHANPTALFHAVTKQYADTKAPINSPIFTGVPAADTAAPGTNTTQLATTAFVTAAITGGTAYLALSGGTLTGPLILAADPTVGLGAATKQMVDLKAPLNSPTFTGVPAGPTATAGTSSAQFATTAFVATAVANSAALYLPLAGGSLTNFLTLHDDPTSALHAATKQYVDLKAPLASPTFTGIPAGPTASPGTATTQFATTAFVDAISTLAMPKTGGTFTGAISIPAPTADAHPATKLYVDNAVALKANLASPTFTGVPAGPTATPGTNTTQFATTAFVTAATALYLPLTGGTLTNFLTLNANPTSALHAATKSYVDTANALKLNLTGGTLSGQLTVDSNIVTTAGHVQISRGGDAASANFYIESDIGFNAQFHLRTVSVARWIFGKDSANETGTGNIGSNFFFSALSDAGSSLGNVFTITRADRVLLFAVSPLAPTPTAGDNTTKIATTAFVTTAGNLKLNLTGGTLSGNLINGGGYIRIDRAGDATTATMYIDADAGFASQIQFRTGGLARWILYKHSDAEGGSDAGSGFRLDAYSDAGSSLGNVFAIARATRIMNFAVSPTGPTPTAGDSTTKFATTAFVANAVAGATTGGVPSGGLANQVLAKVSATNYDMAWVDPAGSGTFLALTGGTMTGLLILSGNPVTDLGAATKGYVDAGVNSKASLNSPIFTGIPAADTAAPGTNTTQLSTTAFVIDAVTTAQAANSAAYLLKAGGTLTGALTLNADPTSALHPATKQYVDAAINLKANIASPVFTGIPAADTAAPGTSTTQLATTAFVATAAALNMPKTGGAFTGAITVLTPTADMHPATKLYVDDAVALKANIASPTFTGIPRADTALAGTNTTQLATTAFVVAADALNMPKAGGAFTGAITVLAPTANTHPATKLYVDNALALKANIASPTFTGIPAADTAAPGTNTTQLATTAFVTAANTLYLPLAGGTLSGGLTVNNNIITTAGYIYVNRVGDAVDANLFLDSDAGFNSMLSFRNSITATRWRMFKNATAEGGGDTGSNFVFQAFSDAVVASTVFSITRADQVVLFAKSPLAPTPLAGDNSTKLATTAFVTSAVAGGGSFLPITGGTLSGPLILAADPLVALGAATKQMVDLKAPIASPIFTGNPTAITQVAGNNSTRLATTAFVINELAPLPSTYLPFSGGTLTNYLTLHANPASPDHAANRAYVDTKAPLVSPGFTGVPTAPTLAGGANDDRIATTAHVHNAISDELAAYMPKTGGTFSGPIYIPADEPVFSTQVVRKAYVDGKIALYLPLIGGTLSGVLNMNSNTITNIPTPTVSHHVANKAYVDLKANIASPTFTGIPRADTATPGTNDTQLATTAFVQSVSSIETVSDAAASSPTGSPDAFTVKGRAATGDGGDGIWNKEADIAAVNALLKFTLGSNIYINRSRKIKPEEAGAKGTGSAGDGAANTNAFNAILNSPEHNWIEIAKPGVYKFTNRLLRSIAGRGMVIEMHPDAELDFSAVGDDGGNNDIISLKGLEGNSTLLTSNVNPGTKVIPVTSAAAFFVGMLVKLMSTALFDPAEGSAGCIGELGMITSISGNNITLLNPIDDSYLVSDAAKLIPITSTGRMHIIGGKLRGHIGIAHRALVFRYALNPIIEGTHFIDFGGVSIVAWDCFGGKADGIDVYGEINTADHARTGYGVAVQDATAGFNVESSTFRRCRHAVTFSNSYTPNGGVARDCIIAHNHVFGTSHPNDDAIDTHNNVLRLKILYNQIRDSLGNGIHVECPDVDIIGNTVLRSHDNGIVSGNGSGRPSRQNISGNTVDVAGMAGIFITHNDPSALVERVDIEDNDIYRTNEEGIRVKGPATKVGITDNLIDSYELATIDGYGGIMVESTVGLEMTGNVTRNPGANVPAVHLFNIDGGRFNGEHHHIGIAATAKRGLLIEATCSDIQVENSRFVATGTAAGNIGIESLSADYVTVKEDVDVVGSWGTKISLGTIETSRDRTLYQPMTFTLTNDGLDASLGSFKLPSNSSYGLFALNPRSGVGAVAHGLFWARGTGSPFCAGVTDDVISQIGFFTGSMTPGGGTAGKLNISVSSAGVVYISNKTTVNPLIVDIALVVG